MGSKTSVHYLQRSRTKLRIRRQSHTTDSKIYYNLKEDFIDNNLVNFEHHPFPLDLAALNAEIILRCGVDKEKKFELLNKIYEKQGSWAVGSDINKINDSLKKIGSEFNLKN